MSANENETIADIVAQIRAAAYIQNADTPKSVLKLADRIEAAWKRETQTYLDQIRDAMNQFWHEKFKSEHAPVGNAAAMRAALKPWISMGEWLLENAGKDALGAGIAEMSPAIRQRLEEARAALSAPPRNCDVGTADEQSERFRAFCHSHMYGFNDPRGYRCKEDCPVKMEICRSDKLCIYCQLVWAQMPYEAQEGGKE